MTASWYQRSLIPSTLRVIVPDRNPSHRGGSADAGVVVRLDPGLAERRAAVDGHLVDVVVAGARARVAVFVDLERETGVREVGAVRGGGFEIAVDVQPNVGAVVGGHHVVPDADGTAPG